MRKLESMGFILKEIIKNKSTNSRFRIVLLKKGLELVIQIIYEILKPKEAKHLKDLKKITKN